MALSRQEKRALGRFAVISVVICKVKTGMSLGQAISEVSKLIVADSQGLPMHYNRSTLYRWYRKYNSNNFSGLTDKPHPKEAVSRSLSKKFVDFLVKEKTVDPDASLPEIIRRAEVDEIVDKGTLSRSSVWRTARRLNLPIFSDKDKKGLDMRRFAHQYRMKMLLCDGKHFRVGLAKVKRVALIFLDDATRFGLGAVVGTAEDRALFLRGLMKILKRFGYMEGLYMDHGPGFDADDTALICSRLNIPIILGRVRYPEGHGKIEKFNQTLKNHLLRGLSDDPHIDTACESLEYRIEHYLLKIYNHRVHKSLNGQTPDKAWEASDRPLSPLTDLQKVEEQFIITISRKVSRDNVIMVDDIPYEMPLGYRGCKVQVFRCFLENKIKVLHEGKHMTLSQVDLHGNARDRRIKREAKKEKITPGRVRTAAQRHFDKDHSCVVSPDGDFYERN